MRVLTVPALALSLAVVGLTPSMAQDQIGDIVPGRRLAEGWCSACHAGDPGMRQPAMAAPTFAEIANRRSTTPLRLRVFLRSSHATMPNYFLTPDEIDDVAAFIMSHKRR